MGADNTENRAATGPQQIGTVETGHGSRRTGGRGEGDIKRQAERLDRAAEPLVPQGASEHRHGGSGGDRPVTGAGRSDLSRHGQFYHNISRRIRDHRERALHTGGGQHEQ